MRFLAFLCLFLSAVASAADVTQVLQEEWSRFRAHVQTLTPDGDIGGTPFKDYEGMTLLWDVSEDARDNEVIRFYMERSDSPDWFSVTYHKSHVIVPGKVVLRRFVGPEPTGWVNHTIDYHTGEYLGSQGRSPNIRRNERTMMRDWGMTQL